MKILASHLGKYSVCIISTNIMKTDHTTIVECIHTAYLSKYSNTTLPQAEETFTSQEML
jgi:hypothetical protein